MIDETYATAQQYAYRFLREAILSGRFAAGTPLKPDRIAKSLGVSRMPVREAIRQLDSEGLVVIRPNRSAVVTSLGPDDVLELYEIRAVLEGLAARLAVPHLTREALDDLRDLDARMVRVEHDPVLWINRHEAFHDYLVRLSRRPRLASQVAKLRDAVQPYFRLHMSVYPSPQSPGYEHYRIVDALATGHRGKAEAAVRDHVMANAEKLESFIREYPVGRASEQAGTVAQPVEWTPQSIGADPR